jgi:hypothetical protein
MAPRDLTNAQLSSRLAFTPGQTPSFLLKLQQRVAGRTTSDDDEEPSYTYSEDGQEFQEGASGRPPIPRRPPPPRRPADQPGSADEKEDGKGELDEDDAEDELPQVVVVKEGKHLSKQEVESEKRKGAQT